MAPSWPRVYTLLYRRCWMLVDVMNRCWSAPLVATSSEGAVLTDLGFSVLAQYRGLQKSAASAAGRSHWPDLARELRGEPLPVQSDE